MKILIKLFMLALSCTFIICSSLPVSATKWIDVTDNEWYTSAVIKVNELGIMNGTSDTTFEPMKKLTRAEYVAILFRLSGGESDLEFSFTDVPAKEWYSKYVGWAEQAGIITGYGNSETFGGNVPITREQLMVMTARYMEYESVSFDDSDKAVEFADADGIASWAREGVEVTRKAALITGDQNGNFNPQKSATRAEIATIVVRYVELLPNARDAMFMKLDKIKDSVVDLTFGRMLDVRPNRADIIGDQLLPQMGLDTDTYQISMSTQDFNLFRQNYQVATGEGAMKPGDTMLASTRLFIRNLETGEKTEEVNFVFNLIYEHITIDPNTYDVHLDDEVLQAAYEKSVYSKGNVARLARVFEKAEAGEDLTVGYIGGSLTSGGQIDTNGNWACATTDWLSHQFPKSTVKGVNAAVGGTNSLYGLVRVEKELLSYAPDIIYIEYSSNDFLGDTTNKSLEALIRTCLTYKEDVAVIIALCHDNNEVSRETHLKLAEYYGLPVLDMREGIFTAMELGNFTKDDFTQDGCHPGTWGHQVQGYMSKNFLSVLIDTIENSGEAELEVQSLPDDMMFGDRYMYMDAIWVSDEVMIDSYGSWKAETVRYEDSDYDVGYYDFDAFVSDGKNGNEPLSFTFKGTDMYVFLHSYTGDGEKAGITVTLNDGERVFEFIDASIPYAVFSGLEEKEYKAEITVTDPNGAPAVISSIVVRNVPSV